MKVYMQEYASIYVLITITEIAVAKLRDDMSHFGFIS